MILSVTTNSWSRKSTPASAWTAFSPRNFQTSAARTCRSLIDEGRVRVERDRQEALASPGIRRNHHRGNSRAAAARCGSRKIFRLTILYEDEDIAIVNKPAGMIVHPGAGADTGTLVAALLHRFGVEKGLSSVGGPLRPGIVHRLDKGTSGAMVIARNDAAHLKLVEEFRERRVQKTYLALLHGSAKGEKGRIELPVARDLRRRSRMTARRSEGREARTDWRLLLRLGAFSLIEADLHTGRTHQIRVHFSALALPVVGDTLYGAPHQESIGREQLPSLGRNFLHSARIALEHPRTGQRMEFRAPLPQELLAYLRDSGLAREIAARWD